MSGPWDLEASAGAAGRSILWRGDWLSTLSYNPYDAVSRGISSYICLTNNSNIDPETDSGTNWQVMAEGGAGTVGPAGPQGPAATIAVGTTTTGAPGSNASVANTGSSSAAVFSFTIPRGDIGATGSTGPAGATGNTGSTGAPGAAATVAAGTTTTGAPGSSASVANVGTSSAAVFNFTIPRGDVGAQGPQGVQGIQGNTGSTGSAGTAATIAVGTTTTGAAGTSASVGNSGTSSAAVFNFTIPRGDTGVQGVQGIQGTAGTAGSAATIAVGTTTTSAPGGSAAVSNSGTSAAAVFDFTIPRGAQGPQGDPGPAGPAGSGSGDVTGPASSVDNEVALFNATTGKLLKRSTGTGYLKVTSGVLQTPAALTKSDVGLGSVDNVQQQPLDSDLTAIAGIAPANDDIIQRKTGAWTNRTPAQFKTDLALTKSDVGLGNVDNTADTAKPVSTAQQTALNLKQDTSAKGVASGYAGLDSGGKVPLAQLPASAASAGDVVGPASSLANELSIYSDTSGKLIGRLTPPAGALVGTTATQTLTGKTLTSPVINTPTGIVKGDVGLGNVDNTSDANKPVSTAQQTALNLKQDTSAKGAVNGYASLDSAGKVPTAQLPAFGTGDVSGQASSVDSEIALFSGTGGKTIKRAAGTGYVTVVNGVMQTPTSADMAGRMPRGHIWGLTISNNVTDVVNDIDIAAGEARDSTNAVDMVLASALTKRLDAAWAVGTNQGGLDTGAIANNTYHVWLIERTDGTVTDALFSLSATAPTMPANYTFKRRIGSIVRVSAAIIRFVQNGDWFDLYTYSDAVGGTIGTTAEFRTLPHVPTGVKMRAYIHVGVSKASATVTLMVTSPDQQDVDAGTGWPPIYTPSSGGYGFSNMYVWTDTSARIRIRAQTTGVGVTLQQMGWMDLRGKES